MTNSSSMLWRRTLAGPVLSPQRGTLLDAAVTTPDVLVRENQLHLYVGAVRDDQERIVMMRLAPEWLTSDEPFPLPEEVHIAVDVGPERFDREHVFDPATVLVEGWVYLYYSAIGPDADTLGLAVSSDGTTFRKRETPVLAGRAPEVVIKDGIIYLFYVKKGSGGGYAVYLSTAEDGETFSPAGAPVFEAGSPGEWDHFEVSTPRLFKRRGIYYMLYAGDSERKDKPRAFGLARSRDLVRWERYPANPVFSRGESGAWDDGAIWFGTVFEWGSRLYLIYEGGTEKAIYRDGPALTQVGLAEVSLDTFDRHMAAWSPSE